MNSGTDALSIWPASAGTTIARWNSRLRQRPASYPGASSTQLRGVHLVADRRRRSSRRGRRAALARDPAPPITRSWATGSALEPGTGTVDHSGRARTEDGGHPQGGRRRHRGAGARRQRRHPLRRRRARRGAEPPPAGAVPGRGLGQRRPAGRRPYEGRPRGTGGAAQWRKPSRSRPESPCTRSALSPARSGGDPRVLRR